MTDPLEGVTDAHLQASLNAAQSGYAVIDIRCCEADSEFRGIIACARQIAATEKLAAELAELRAKYEPEPVDPVLLAARELVAARSGNNNSYASRILRGEEDGLGAIQNAMLAIRRGMEMQPDPFTREDAERIAAGIAVAEGFTRNGGTFDCVLRALTTPHAELRAMLGDG